MHKLVTYKPK